ncbi:MAG: hypothetical protein PHG85_04140 [Candidatus Altiarchaeota archaeon]|nr:hypothetical protein [Candidatus Altiarchaeota archaeon]
MVEVRKVKPAGIERDIAGGLLRIAAGMAYLFVGGLLAVLILHYGIVTKNILLEMAATIIGIMLFIIVFGRAYDLLKRGFDGIG